MEIGARTEPLILVVDFTSDPVQRGLARAVGRGVHRERRNQFQASGPRSERDEARERAGFEQSADRLEEHNGADNVDLTMSGIER
jgi:hypothetical protein